MNTAIENKVQVRYFTAPTDWEKAICQGDYSAFDVYDHKELIACMGFVEDLHSLPGKTVIFALKRLSAPTEYHDAWTISNEKRLVTEYRMVTLQPNSHVDTATKAWLANNSIAK